MLILLLRHATAEAHGGKPDSARALVEKGWKQARRAGAFCRRLGLVPDVVLTSPLLRARQTAVEFVRVCGGTPDPVDVPWLDLGRASDIIEELDAYRALGIVCLVGHEPDFSTLAAILLGCRAEGVRVRKASLIGLECTAPVSGRGQLVFSVPNAFLADEGEK